MKQIITLSAQDITLAGDKAWKVSLPEALRVGAEPVLPHENAVLIEEDGRALGPYHVFPSRLKESGGGIYCVCDDTLLFSTSDNSDPRTNGRVYTIRQEINRKWQNEPMLDLPSMVAIETINTCNARCVFCPLFQGPHQMDRTRRPARIMDTALSDHLLSEIAEWPTTPQIFLNMDGEPLQDPHFIARMLQVRTHGLGRCVRLQSNGQLMTEEKALAILDAEIRNLTFGFDGGTKETYEAHRVRCTFETVLENIKMFARLRDERGRSPNIQIKFVRTRKNAHEVQMAYELFNAFLDPARDTFEDMLAIDWSDAPDAGDTGLYYIGKIGADVTASGCRALETQMIVLSDGRVSACCFDYNLEVAPDGLGMLSLDTSLAEVWRAKDKREELAGRLRAGNKEHMPYKCRNCPALCGFKTSDPPAAALPEKVVSEDQTGFIYKYARSAS